MSEEVVSGDSGGKADKIVIRSDADGVTQSHETGMSETYLVGIHDRIRGLVAEARELKGKEGDEAEIERLKESAWSYFRKFVEPYHVESHPDVETELREELESL